ncbi:hypothetical protein SEVIR_8G261565v4 [Setaria viridis]|uniref:Acidic protein n=2 Tax=Setaria TaxID=4554 RepID=K3ZKL4_SETIT|nr:hypothetical protein SETIT_8G251400v2 [Setaria italica]TKW02766.1 hypothetical protein SEVIR_8G261499v2 [Setaria viridis]TKW02767.1 hypothetical protein SEVIR_8G261532v2 [Setaria viridis]TKW02768.1 hypothetical protein SEVIR_8G261532v2 [Setaria viridis]TKW02769.1 hypothetical protein SEVIR_8G261565v2 [Setaria viridis]
MEGKRTTTLMVIMCLVILSLNVNPTAAECGCCASAQAKLCCQLCIRAGASDAVCKNTCCFPCFLDDSVAAKMVEMEVLAKMEGAGQA